MMIEIISGIIKGQSQDAIMGDINCNPWLICKAGSVESEEGHVFLRELRFHFHEYTGAVSCSGNGAISLFFLKTNPLTSIHLDRTEGDVNMWWTPYSYFQPRYDDIVCWIIFVAHSDSDRVENEDGLKLIFFKKRIGSFWPPRTRGTLSQIKETRIKDEEAATGVHPTHLYIKCRRCSSVWQWFQLLLQPRKV